MAAPEQQKTLYLRNVPARLVRQAKMKAARDGTTLTAVVIDALTRSLDAATAATPAAAGDPLADSIAWFEEHRDRLLRRHAGEYVAIVDRKVVDHDPDFERLATRVFERLGTRPVFMPRLAPHAEPLRVRSPRRAP
jgi:hypothetical protein